MVATDPPRAVSAADPGAVTRTRPPIVTGPGGRAWTRPGRRSTGRAARLAVASLLALAAPAAARRDPANWRDWITVNDRSRLKDWRIAWIEALDQARQGGFGAAIDREGALLQPDAGLERPTPPDGAYRCRIVKLGNPVGYVPPGHHAFTAFPAARCRIVDHRLETLDGEQRPSGRLYADDGARLLFLGGLALGDEPGFVRYQRDPQRALVGLVERIGPARWRLVLPKPAWESHLDVMELVPAAG